MHHLQYMVTNQNFYHHMNYLIITKLLMVGILYLRWVTVCYVHKKHIQNSIGPFKCFPSKKLCPTKDFLMDIPLSNKKFVLFWSWLGEGAHVIWYWPASVLHVPHGAHAEMPWETTHSPLFSGLKEFRSVHQIFGFCPGWIRTQEGSHRAGTTP